MRIKRIYIDGYKNLNGFDVSFSSDQTVIIGQNASGKSNLLEAIVIIYRNLDYSLDPEFDFAIHYEIHSNEIIIKGNCKDKERKRYSIWKITEDGTLFDIQEQANQIFTNKNIKSNLSFNKFQDEKDIYLPKHVFVYYSGLGNSNRIEELLHKPDKEFALALVKNTTNEKPADRRFFYVRLHHSQIVLLSFYALNLDKDIAGFLTKNLNIEDLATITFVLKRPSWGPRKDGDPKFWGSKGVVSDFLNELFAIATAPLRDERPNRIDIWREPKEERLILHISSIEKIKKLVKERDWDNIQFFNIIDSINASDLHRDIKISIKKKHADTITFKDLSEGEQQLLTVLGLMRFTRYDESLYLLDEPDTHLNPLWRWQYMQFISKIALRRHTSQVIMTSHDPFTIGSLTHNEVRVFKTDEQGNASSAAPVEDPRGMGTAGILTEIFDLPTTLDIPTQAEIDEQRKLKSISFFGESMTEKEESRLKELTLKLDNLGYVHVFRDPLFQKFEMEFARAKRKRGMGLPTTQVEVDELNQLATDLLEKLINNEIPEK